MKFKSSAFTTVFHAFVSLATPVTVFAPYVSVYQVLLQDFYGNVTLTHSTSPSWCDLFPPHHHVFERVSVVAWSCMGKRMISNIKHRECYTTQPNTSVNCFRITVTWLFDVSPGHNVNVSQLCPGQPVSVTWNHVWEMLLNELSSRRRRRVTSLNENAE